MINTNDVVTISWDGEPIYEGEEVFEIDGEVIPLDDLECWVKSRFSHPFVATRAYFESKEWE